MTTLTYQPPLFLGNGHLQTIVPTLFRKSDISIYRRERMEMPDGDFIDLDWAETGSRHLVIISHGLEGNTHRAYITNMARAMNRAGMDALAWNYRGCSQEPNRLLRFYHNGATDDLIQVIEHAADTGRYTGISLVGFSLGGNLTLMYLGREAVSPMIRKAVVFSVPCHLKSCSETLAKPANRIYMKRFLKLLHEKIRAKMAMMPDKISDDGYDAITDFKSFDDRYTAPIHGFRDAEDYWETCSSLQYFQRITTPVLMVNAANDPFLPATCYPVDEVKKNPRMRLEVPTSGGHVGFMELNRENCYWSEKRAALFLTHP